jgi:hypothetical protein
MAGDGTDPSGTDPASLSGGNAPARVPDSESAGPSTHAWRQAMASQASRRQLVAENAAADVSTDQIREEARSQVVMGLSHITG